MQRERWTVVGRERELEHLLDAWRGPQPLVLAAPPGAGRTRVADEVVERIRIAGDDAVVIRGSQPVADTLAELAAHLVDQPSTNHPVVVVDDADLLDDDAVARLAAIARHDGARLFLTRRVAPRRAGMEQALGLGAVRRISLDPLPTTMVRFLVERALDPDVDTALAGAIVSGVGGDLALLDAVLDDIEIHGVGGGELASGVHAIELAADRVGQLPASDRGTLELLALVGPAPIGALTGLDLDEIVPLERAGVARLSQVDGRWWVDACPPFLGTAIRAGMPLSRRIQLLASPAAELVDAEVPFEVASRLEGLLSDAAIAIPPPLHGALAQAAYSASDLDLASVHAAAGATQHWRAAFVQGELARMGGDEAASLAWFEIAASLATEPAAAVRVALAISGVLAWHCGQPERAIEALDAAAARLGSDPAVWELRCEAAFLSAFLGRFDDAIRGCRAVLTAPGLDALTTWNASLCLAFAQVMTADVDDVGPVLLRSGSLVDTVVVEHPDSRDLHTALCVARETLDGELVAAIGRTDAFLADVGDGAFRGMTASTAVETLLLAGDARARDVAQLALEELARWDSMGTRPVALAYAAAAEAALGASDLAATLLATWRQEVGDPRSVAVAARAAARLAGPDELQGALTSVLDASCTAAESGYVAHAVTSLLDLLNWRDRAGVSAAPMLATLGRRGGSVLLRTVSRLSAAWTSAEPQALEVEAAALWSCRLDVAAVTTFRQAASLLPPGVAARRAAARGEAIALGLAPLLVPGDVPLVPDAPTVRELTIACRAAAGASNPDIAREEFLSPRTVGNHLQHVYDKLELAGRTELAALLARP